MSPEKALLGNVCRGAESGYGIQGSAAALHAGLQCAVWRLIGPTRDQLEDSSGERNDEATV